MSKYWGVLLVCLWSSIAWANGSAVTQQVSNGPLICGSMATYWPSGIRWAGGLDRPVVMRLSTSGFPQPGVFSLPQNAVRDAIVRAMEVWNNVVCSGGGNPSIRLELGTDVQEGSASATESIIRLERSSAGWPASGETIALTRKTHLSSTQMLMYAKITFNGITHLFRAQDNSGVWHGCDAAATNCHDLTAVLVHELGHVLGFEHVSCNDAILSPTGMPDGTYRLSRHEIAGVCAVYPPSAIGQEGLYCDEFTPCGAGMSCRRDPGQSDSRWRYGYCAMDCQEDVHCSEGWMCRIPVGSSVGQCLPGPRFPGLAEPIAAEPVDVCANCSSGADCTSYACAFGVDGSSQGRCSKTCTDHSSCPSGFRCTIANGTTGICLPAQQDSCVDRFRGLPQEAKCYQQPDQDNPDGMNLPCREGLACVIWEQLGQGYCLPKCHATDPQWTCAAGSTCCFGLDNNGACASATATGTAVGGCFATRRYGDACGEPSQRLCPQNTACISTGHPSLARCFGVCPDGPSQCQSNESCVTQQAFNANLCCATGGFSAQNPLGTCAPAATRCARLAGVLCDSDGDCLSGLCLTYGGQRACSLPCNDDMTCTGASNAASRCIPMADGQRCWPISGPSQPPLCAEEQAKPAPKKKQGCQQVGASGWGIMLGLALRATWRRVRTLR